MADIQTDWRKLFNGPVEPNYLQDELTPEEMDLLENYLSPAEPQQPMGMADSLMARSSIPQVAPIELPPPAGMADSLVQRSGDDLEKPELPKVASVPKREPASTSSPIVKAAMASASEEPDEFAAAQDERDRLMGILMMARGSEKIGTSIAGVKSDPEFLKELIPLAKAKTEDVVTKQKLASDKQDQQAKSLEIDLAKQATDPNSRVSQIARDMAKQFVPEFNTQGASAQQLKAYLPTLVNAAEAKASREARLEAARIAADVKKENKEKDEENKKFTQAQALGDRVTKADTDTGYSAGRAALRSIRLAQKSNKWDSTMDIETLYRFIKLLDPGSVVREGEIALASKGESVLAGITKQPGRITRGDILSQEFRKKLAAAIERNYHNAKQDFDDRIAPLKKRAEAHNVDLDQVVGENLLYGEAPVEEQKVKIREKDSGRVKQFSPDQAAKLLKNPNYEKVQ